jgi:hypothetical protein
MDIVVSTLQSYATPILLVLIQVLIIILGKVTWTLVKKLVEKIGVESDSVLLENIKSLIDSVVVTMNQKVVDDLKAANPDNKLTDEQQEQIFNEVKDAVYKFLTSEQISYLLEQYASVDDGLMYLIEQSVNYNHN